MTTVDELRYKLGELNLETRGNKDSLKARLLKANKSSHSPSSSSSETELEIKSSTRPEGEEFERFLIFDVEATCEKLEGRLAFSYPNEVIEFPVIVLGWELSAEGIWSLIQIDKFHSYVKPTWRPQLSEFCTELTGITQAQVDAAPTYPRVLKLFEAFIDLHSLFTKELPTAFVCDGKWDLLCFISKQAFISQIERPDYLAGPMIDIKLLVALFFSDSSSPSQAPTQLSIPCVLASLSLAPFEGRLHSGMDDTQNVARILIELARRGVKLKSNRVIPEGGKGGKEKRWGWMKRGGKIDWDRFREKELKNNGGGW